MQVKNTTNNDIAVTIKGIAYEVKAEGTLDNVPEEHARYWQENLHKFLQVKKDKLEGVDKEPVVIPTPKAEATVASDKPVVEEKKEEVKEPAPVTEPVVKVTAPATTAAKTAVK